MTRYLLSLNWRKSPGRFPRDPPHCPQAKRTALRLRRYRRTAPGRVLCHPARVSSGCLRQRGGATQDSVAPASTARPGPSPPGRGIPGTPGHVAETGAHCPSDAADAQSCLRAAAPRPAVAASRLPPRLDGIPARPVTQPDICQCLAQERAASQTPDSDLCSVASGHSIAAPISAMAQISAICRAARDPVHCRLAGALC